MFRKFLPSRDGSMSGVLTESNSEPLVIGDAGNTTTLNHLLYLYGLAENRTIGEVMDTNGFLCYNYD